MAQVPEELLWRIMMFSPYDVVVKMFPPSEFEQGGGDGSCGTAMLKMAASWFSADVSFYPSFVMGSG